jgi:N-methylhydantoinase A
MALQVREISSDTIPIAAAQKSIRPVYFVEQGCFVDCPIDDRYRLPAGQVIIGPAVVEELDSTTVIHLGYRARVDSFGNLLMAR